MREVTKKEFDTFLNYFQDRQIRTSLLCNSTTFFDNFDDTPLAEFRKGRYYLFD